MKIDELVNENYDKLTENDHQIFKYISKNKSKIGELTSEELAEKCHVSRTTLLRFCHRLDLKSFAELKYLLKSQEYTEDQNLSINIEEACRSYHKIIDEMRQYKYTDMCSFIYNAETIYIYGTGNAQKAEADAFKHMFLSIGKCVIELFDLGEVQFMQSKFAIKDLFIIISLSGETLVGIDILKSIEKANINTLSITRFDNNTIARMCKYNLYVETKMLHGYKNLNYEMTAAFYVLLDILFVNYLEYSRGRKYEN